MLLKFKPSLLWILAALSGSYAFGWGLVVPGQLGEPSDYYMVREGKVYRYLCPKGIEPNETDCKLDGTFLHRYAEVAARMENELNTGVKENREAIKKEKAHIVDSHPQVIEQRKAIAAEIKEIQELGAKSAQLLGQAATLQANLKTIQSELAEVNKELTTQGLSADKLARLIEQRKRLITRETYYKDQIAGIDGAVKEAEAAITKLNTAVAEASQKLAALLPVISLQSPTLTTLVEQRNLLEAEIELLPEIGKRLEEKFAYGLDEWAATGTPGVLEISNRFLRIVGCKRRLSTTSH